MISGVKLVSIVNQHVNGITSQQLAAELGYDLKGLSSRLAKLRNYGIIGGRTLSKVPGRPFRGEVQWLPKTSPLCEPVNFKRRVAIAPQMEATVVRLELDGTPRKVMRYETQLTDEIIKRVLQKNQLQWRRMPGTSERAPIPDPPSNSGHQNVKSDNLQHYKNRMQQTDAFLVRLLQERSLRLVRLRLVRLLQERRLRQNHENL
jgi:hypothetical protein